MSSENFWDNIYTQNPTRTPNENDPVLLTALNYFGDVSGARLLDLGCGDGRSSLFFAKRGANVTAVDISAVSINNLSKFCLENSIDNITPVQCSAFDIDKFEPFDLVFGTMILHHLEPFGDFAKILRSSMLPSAKAYFYENSAFSNLLIWFRKNVIGKYGIPKFGDDDEFPLMPEEVDHLKSHFNVTVAHPELLFFRLASIYILKGKLHGLTNKLDEYFFQFPNFRKYSYRQNLFLSYSASHPNP